MEIDSERQKLAREYARQRRSISLTNIFIAVIGIIFIFWTGLDTALRDWLQPLAWQPLTGWFPVQVLVYFAVLMLAFEIITTPMNFYAYTLSRRYGISTMSANAWVADLFKGLALSLLFELIIVELIYLLLATQPQIWWLEVALALLFFSVILANLAPVLLFPIFYKFTPLPDGDLKQRLLALADRAHTRVQGVYTMSLSNKTTAANAALMGLGNTRRIVLGDTMLDHYTLDEIEVVLAHELGHQVHHDMWKLILSQSFLMLVGLFLVNLVLHWAVDVQNFYPSLSDPATIPLLLVLTALFGLIVLPLSNAITRAVENQADEYALESTQKVAAFKGAMSRIANQNLADIEPSPLVEIFFHDHPSVTKRLKHADAFASRHGIAITALADTGASVTQASEEATAAPEGMLSSSSSTPDETL